MNDSPPFRMSLASETFDSTSLILAGTDEDLLCQAKLRCLNAARSTMEYGSMSAMMRSIILLSIRLATSLWSAFIANYYCNKCTLITAHQLERSAAAFPQFQSFCCVQQSSFDQQLHLSSACVIVHYLSRIAFQYAHNFSLYLHYNNNDRLTAFDPGQPG